MTIAEVEAQLLRHAQAERRRWQEVAPLLMQVERERLWEGHATSFTAWIQGVARRLDLQESVLWRCLKAGRIYVELTGNDEIEAKASVSAESLELADKIRRHAPRAVTREVVERTLDGELTRAELRGFWDTYRPAAGGTTARGRLPDDPDARTDAIATRRAILEAEKRKPENRADVQRAELVSAFRSAAWLSGCDQARAETRIAAMSKSRIASILVVRPSGAHAERLDLHGLWTCVSMPELADFEFAAPAGIDYMWLASVPDLMGRARSKAPHMLGLLEQLPDRSLRVVRHAERRPSSGQARVELLSILLQRAYLWP